MVLAPEEFIFVPGVRYGVLILICFLILHPFETARLHTVPPHVTHKQNKSQVMQRMWDALPEAACPKSDNNQNSLKSANEAFNNVCSWRAIGCCFQNHMPMFEGAVGLSGI